jgi:hypothetical protein
MPFPPPTLPYATSRDKLRYVMIDDDGGFPAIQMSHFVDAHSEYHRWYVVTHRKWSTEECEEPS